jgi:hypothetical protein
MVPWVVNEKKVHSQQDIYFPKPWKEKNTRFTYFSFIG